MRECVKGKECDGKKRGKECVHECRLARETVNCEL